jgi:hypothetical protein
MTLTTAARRLRVAALAACAIGLAGASTAHAAPAANPLGCLPTHDLSTPLSPLGDGSLYALAPGGSFEPGTIDGWTLTNASIADENEPYGVLGDGGTSSLELGSRGVAVSAPMCIDETYPNFRFFVRNKQAAKATLQVSVLFMDAKGKIGSVKSGTFSGKGPGWQLVDPMKIGIDIHPTATNASAPVAFEFTAGGKNGDWLVDDLLVDPYRRG